MTGGGHWALTPPGSNQKVYISNTPSDWRSLKNDLAQLRRYGLITRPSMPGPLPSTRTEKMRLMNLLLKKANEARLSNLDFAQLVGESEASVARWRAGGLPKMSLARLKEAIDLFQPTHQPTHQPRDTTPAPQPNPVPTPIHQLSGQADQPTPILVERRLEVNLQSLSIDQLTTLAQQVLDEIKRRMH